MFLHNHLKENDVFVDIGANIGTYTLVASKIVGNKGTVIAFEPVHTVFERLVENARINDLQNIIILWKVIYSNTGTMDIFISKNDNLGMSGIFHHDNESGKIERAEAITLEDFFEETGINQVNMIKIDIEGAELYALHGMKKVLQKFHPSILMEISEDVLLNAPYNPRDIIKFMEKLQYRQYGIDRMGILQKPGEVASYTNYAFIPE